MRFRAIVLVSIAIVLVTITVNFISYFANSSFGASNIESDSENAQRLKLVSESSEEEIANKSHFIVAPDFKITGEALNINNSQLPIAIDNLKGKECSSIFGLIVVLMF